MEVPSSEPRGAPKRSVIVSIRERLGRTRLLEQATSRPVPEEAGGALSGWKAIAAHFGVQIRTAQRWASLYGLPVRRYPGQKGRVYALPEELDRWRLTRQGSAAVAAPAAWWRLKVPFPGWIVAALLPVACAWLGYRHFSRVSAVPHAFRVDGHDLIVMDAAKKELFRRSFPIAPDPGHFADGSPPFLTHDLDRDGRPEVLFRYHPSLRHRLSGRLTCFSSTGRVKWEFHPGRQIPFDHGKLSTGLYGIGLLRILPASKGILVSGINSPNWPCQVALLSNEGKLQAECWHPGHLTYLTLADVDGDGKDDALLSGVNNPAGTGTLVVLDLERLARAPRTTASDGIDLPALAPGVVKKAILFRKSCLCQKFAPYNWATLVAPAPDGFLVHVIEDSGLDGPVLIYHLDRSLNVTRITPSTAFLDRHKELFAQRKLDHAFTDQELIPLKRVAVIVPGAASTMPRLRQPH